MEGRVAAPRRAYRGMLRLRAAAIGAFLFLSAAALLAPMLTYPFGRDQGMFACVADVLSRGGTLYRDTWDLKPPAVYYLYWMSLAVFGHSMLAPRLLDFLYTLATAGVLVLIGARLRSLWVGIAGAFLFLCRYALGFDYWHTAQADGFASLPLALAVLAMPEATKRSWPLAFLAGALTGIAVITKFTLAIFLILPLVALLWRRQEPRMAGLGRAAGYLLGACAVIGAAVLFIWRAGALKDMIEIIFTWNAGYAAIRPPAPALLVIPYQTGRFLFGGRYLVLKLIGALGLIGLVDSLRRPRRPAPESPWRWMIPLWLALMLLQVWVQGKYFEYHWLPALPPLGLLAGQGIAVLARSLRATGRPALALRAAAIAGIAALLVSFASAYRAHFSRPIAYATGSLPAAQFLADFRDRQDFSLTADLQVATFLRQHTSPGTPIFIWGFEPIVYFLADRPPASRFLSQQPLVTPWSPLKWRRELMEDLMLKPPPFILVLHSDLMPWVTMRPYDSAQELAHYPELAQLLADHYRPIARIEDFDIWEAL